MFLQATLDCPSLEAALAQVRKYTGVPEIDYVELGAPMVSHYGIAGAQWLYDMGMPQARIYVDTKIIDFPEMELAPYIEQGFTRFSAMAVMNDDAFRQLADLREKHGLTIFVSMMGYPDIAQRSVELLKLGFADQIAHGAGVNGSRAFSDLLRIMGILRWIRGVNIIAAGGISWKNAKLLQEFPVAGVISGRGLAEASDVRYEAARLRENILGANQTGE